MPKQIHTLNNFSGGINNLKDPRDLSQNELANAVDVMLDKQGVIRTRGGEAGYESTINDRAATIAAGYGLAVFESDFGARTYSSTGTAGAESIDFIDKDINKPSASLVIKGSVFKLYFEENVDLSLIKELYKKSSY